MKNNILILLFLIPVFTLSAQNSAVKKANYKLADRFSPENVEKMVFSTRVDPHWLKNSEKFWYMFETSSGKTYYLVDPDRRTKKVLFDNVKIAADMSRLTGDPFDAKHIDIEKLKFIKNETVLQFEVTSKLVEEEETEEEELGKKQEDEKEIEKKASDDKKMTDKVWHFEYNLSTKVLKLIKDFEEPLEQKKWASIAPNEEYVIFSKHHNLYWMDSANYKKAQKNEEDSTIIEHQLTADGVEHFSYGVSDRGETNIDKEENKDKRKRANVIFSRDSKKFAMLRSDYRDVKDLWVINSVDEPRPTLETYKYHMPGEKEAPQTELLIFDWETKEKLRVKADTFKDQTISIFRAPGKKSNRDDDVKFTTWLSESSDKIYFKRTSRDLKRIDICVANTTTGKVSVLIEERLNTYVETRDPGLVGNGKEIIHWSERDGWAHFYLYDDKGELKNQITSGPWHCQSIEGIDEENRVLYFTANGREPGEDPYYLHLYRVNFDGSGLKILNKGDFYHRVSLNDQNHYFVNNYSRVNTAPRSCLYDNEGNKLINLEQTNLSRLFEAGYNFPEPFKVKAGDGITDIYGVMYKPFDFDSTKKYPVIAYVYPGPQTEAVYKTFTTRMNRTDRMAQFGFIVVAIGNRGGHPSRSKWYHNWGYGNLRDYGLEDKKVGLEQLANRHKYIDIDKVGIFGHSGGGFMSTAALLVYPDFFKVAVSSSGNHENNIYNRWWSEKHHGVKEVISEKGDTTFEYSINKNSEIAGNLKGKLLITTGDIDNNVNPANTIRLAQALIKANKRFDFFIFPGQRHGYGDMSEYFFWLRGDYFCKHLIGNYSDNVDIIEIKKDKPRKK